jgi:2-polyprenyl-3-methyl-5-hydroxy-6-metoxy-1,4-benzoquinol methylase
MKTEIVTRLVALNRTFYTQFAAPFADSRTQPWPGFARLARALPSPCAALLDVGCGNGRLGRYLFTAGTINAYVGVDFSPPLLALGVDHANAQFIERNLVEPDCLSGLGQFDGVACVATMQHVPGVQNRVHLLRAMGERLTLRGRLVVANWQFLDNPRQERKIVPWATIGLADDDVESADYLLSWDRGGQGHRYVAYIDSAAIARMADSAELRIVDQFRSDGHEGNLNLYTVLALRS